jgi:hypothetical protein
MFKELLAKNNIDFKDFKLNSTDQLFVEVSGLSEASSIRVFTQSLLTATGRVFHPGNNPRHRGYREKGTRAGQDLLV